MLSSAGLSRYRFSPNNCASRSGAPPGLVGLSENRTVLDTVRAPLGRRFDVEFATGADGAPVGEPGEVVACWKSGDNAGSFGCVRVDALEGEEKPWNWEVRSLYCFCKPGRASVIVSEPLLRY